MPIYTSYGMEYFTDNMYTTREQRTLNAKYAFYFMQKYLGGWTVESIAAMCGNWESESGINPGIWENLDYGNLNTGYGLVQWTPASKLIDWANEEQLDWMDMATNLMRIEYELQNNLQWESSYLYPMTFNQFKHSHIAPFRLAGAFCINYENATSPDLHERGTQANNWYRYFQTLAKPKIGSIWPKYLPRVMIRQQKGR